MNSNLSTTIRFYDNSIRDNIEEDFNPGKIYPFSCGRKNYPSLLDETELIVYLDDDYCISLRDKDHFNIQTQLENREILYREVAKLEEAGVDITLYFQISSYEGEIIPAEEFIPLAKSVNKVRDLEEWAEKIVDDNQKDWHLSKAIISAIDYGKLIEGLLEEKKLTACENGDEWLLYPTR